MVIQELRRANTRGSPTAPLAASLVRTRANDEAAAAQPASATTHTLDRLGARTAPILASDASADAAMPLTPLSRECPQHVDGTSQAQPLMRVAQRTRMKGGVCSRGYSPTRTASTRFAAAALSHARGNSVSPGQQKGRTSRRLFDFVDRGVAYAFILVTSSTPHFRLNP